MQDERKWLNEALAHRSLRPATDRDWEDFGYEIVDKSDAEYFAELIADSRASTRPSARRGQRPKGAEAAEEQAAVDPTSWEAYRRRLFAPFAFEVQWTRGRLGIRHPLPTAEVAPWLRREKDCERQEGDSMLLAVPVLTGSAVEVEEWTVYRGYEMHGRTESEPAQPLFELARYSKRIADRTGVDSAEAVFYLLSDELPNWSVARATVEWRPRFAIVVRVEWPFIDPKLVADLFTRARGRLYRPGAASVEERRLAGRKAWSMELVHFVSERRHAGVAWEQICQEWNRAYPSKKHDNWRGLRRSFDNAMTYAAEMSLVDSLRAPWRPRMKQPLVFDGTEDS
jgi:hypothetical protein